MDFIFKNLISRHFLFLKLHEPLSILSPIVMLKTTKSLNLNYVNSVILQKHLDDEFVWHLVLGDNSLSVCCVSVYLASET